MKKIISLILAVIMVFALVSFSACSSDTDDGSNSSEDSSEWHGEEDNPIATIVVKDYGTITVELYYDEAPNTVKNFISLANSGFYDGLTFHRVIEGFMIQGGDPNGDGTGGPGYSIQGEFSSNGIENNVEHVRGTISMGRTNDYDSAGSQFFICQEDYSYGDGNYAAFGMVTDGIEVVDAIAEVDTDSNDKPEENIVIESITVDTKGIYYDEPETIAA
ncbi:MAG: peptidylprolyl isomerase [Clostridiales bacterium]|nr:peptidylprolyl isomerase [Clostridiales bacterium]